MANDLAIGVDFATLNTMIASAWSCQKTFPKKYAGGGDPAVASVTFDMTQPPSLELRTDFSPPSLVVKFSDVRITLALQDDGTAIIPSGGASVSGTASVWFGVAIIPSPNNNTFALYLEKCTMLGYHNPNPYSQFDINARAASLDIPAGLNDDLAEIFSAISIPALSSEGEILHLGVFGGINVDLGAHSLWGMYFQQQNFSLEVGSSNDNCLIMYAGLGQQPAGGAAYPTSTQPAQPPTGTPWPTGTWFVALDDAALNALAGYALQSKSGSWSADPFSADYTVQYGATNLSVGTGGQISGTLNISGSASFTFHNHIPYVPNLTASASFGGSGNFTVTPSAESDGQKQDIYLTLNHVSINLGGLGGLPVEFGPMSLSDVLSAIQQTVLNQLSGYKFQVYTLAPTSFSVAGTPITIAPQNLAFNSITGPGGQAMETITFTLDFTTA